jgi:hypothetical protein
MKGFYKTTALLVSLFGISNISCGAAGDAIAIHETEKIGQVTLHSIEGGGDWLKNGKDYLKEHPGKCIGAIVGISAVVAVAAIALIIRYVRNHTDVVVNEGEEEGEEESNEGKEVSSSENERDDDSSKSGTEEEIEIGDSLPNEKKEVSSSSSSENEGNDYNSSSD